ncbi:hypothetical protein O9G_003400 [Rozella allomycis CSF55]|uniref:Uncharacterized protein n=1 Tax=Rozella allomycis (strain CSF55) TaxID=988480 RepID=A0A075B3P6_ROZAC|nr:hypothetical protein O9G_003400 [Rozella allomycis CSF55]|eukprot:EPZ35508.1 hypothetical protein O9G_003400 [Rozella allomycis CSF55]
MEPIAHITKAHYKELLGDDVISHGIADVNLECKELDIYSTLSPKYIKTVKNQNAKFKAAAENNCQTASLIVPILDNYLKSILTVFSSFMGDEIVLSESAFMDAVDIRNAISQLGDYKDDQVVPVYDKFRKPIESPHDIRCINCKNVCEVLDCQSEIYQELDKNVRKSPVNLQVKKLETENFKLRKMAVECRDKVLDKIKEIEDVLDVFKSLFPPNALMCFLKDFRLIKLLVPRINTFYFNGAKAGSCRASIHECEISYVEYLKIRSRDDLTKLKQEVEKMEPIPYITKEQYEEFMRILGNSVNDVQEESDPDQNPDKIESQKEEISHDDGEEIVLQPDEKVDNSHVEASSDSIEDESIEFIDSLEYELQDTEEIVTQQLDALILEDEKEKIEPRTDDEQTIDEEISTPLLPVESESQEEVKVSLFENQSMEQIDNDTVEHEINAYEDEHNNASEPQKDENEKQQIDLVIHDSDDEAIEIEEPIDVNVATSQNGQEETIQTDYREECDMQRDEEVFIEAVSQNVKNQSFELREPVEFALETAVENPFEFPKNDESIVHKDFLEVNINTDDLESQQVQISVKDESVQCTDPVECEPQEVQEIEIHKDEVAQNVQDEFVVHNEDQVGGEFPRDEEVDLEFDSHDLEEEIIERKESVEDEDLNVDAASGHVEGEIIETQDQVEEESRREKEADVEVESRHVEDEIIDQMEQKECELPRDQHNDGVVDEDESRHVGVEIIDKADSVLQSQEVERQHQIDVFSNNVEDECIATEDQVEDELQTEESDDKVKIQQMEVSMLKKENIITKEQVEKDLQEEVDDPKIEILENESNEAETNTDNQIYEHERSKDVVEQPLDQNVETTAQIEIMADNSLKEDAVDVSVDDNVISDQFTIDISMNVAHAGEIRSIKVNEMESVHEESELKEDESTMLELKLLIQRNQSQDNGAGDETLSKTDQLAITQLSRGRKNDDFTPKSSFRKRSISLSPRFLDSGLDRDIENSSGNYANQGPSTLPPQNPAACENINYLENHQRRAKRSRSLPPKMLNIDIANSNQYKGIVSPTSPTFQAQPNNENDAHCNAGHENEKTPIQAVPSNVVPSVKVESSSVDKVHSFPPQNPIVIAHAAIGNDVSFMKADHGPSIQLHEDLYNLKKTKDPIVSEQNEYENADKVLDTSVDTNILKPPQDVVPIIAEDDNKKDEESKSTWTTKLFNFIKFQRLETPQRKTINSSNELNADIKSKPIGDRVNDNDEENDIEISEKESESECDREYINDIRNNKIREEEDEINHNEVRMQVDPNVSVSTKNKKLQVDKLVDSIEISEEAALSTSKTSIFPSPLNLNIESLPTNKSLIPVNVTPIPSSIPKRNRSKTNKQLLKSKSKRKSNHSSSDKLQSHRMSKSKRNPKQKTSETPSPDRSSNKKSKSKSNLNQKAKKINIENRKGEKVDHISDKPLEIVKKSNEGDDEGDHTANNVMIIVLSSLSACACLGMGVLSYSKRNTYEQRLLSTIS